MSSKQTNNLNSLFWGEKKIRNLEKSLYWTAWVIWHLGNSKIAEPWKTVIKLKLSEAAQTFCLNVSKCNPISLKIKYFHVQLVLNHSWFYFPAYKLHRSGDKSANTKDYAVFKTRWSTGQLDSFPSSASEFPCDLGVFVISPCCGFPAIKRE